MRNRLLPPGGGLRYIDRAGEEITRDVWWNLVLDLEYCYVFRTALPNYRASVDTSWLGVWCANHEAVPKPFCVRVLAEDASGRSLLAIEWHETEPDALAAHQRAAERLAKSGR